LEFVVAGTPVTSQGSSDNRRYWQHLIKREAEAAANGRPPAVEDMAFRLAYFYVNAPIGDLDNIVKPIQDALKGIAYVDDRQVVDLVASMRRKTIEDHASMTATLARGFLGGSDFIYVVVEQSSRIEVFR
jgi:crossover junction endodeoxyribonuclease RusA